MYGVHVCTFSMRENLDGSYIENLRKMSTKNLKSKTSEKPLENLWFLVFEHIRNMSTKVRISKFLSRRWSDSLIDCDLRCYITVVS